MTSIFGLRGGKMSAGPAARGDRRRGKPPFILERLEPRTLLAAMVSVASDGAVYVLSQTFTGATLGLSYNAGTDTYTITDTGSVAPATVNPAFTYTQVGLDTATLTPVDPATQDFASLTFDQNVENIIYQVESLGNDTTFEDMSLATPVGTPLTDNFDFGNSTGLAQAFTGNVTIALTKELAAIAINDSDDTTSQAINVTSSQVNFDTTPSFSYGGTTVTSLDVLSGSGDNAVTVSGTPSGTKTAITLGSGDDYVTVVGAGLSTSPQPSLTLDGGAGVNTLDVNATGNTVVSASAGTVTFTSGAMIDYSNFSVTKITSYPTNTAPVLTAASTLTAVENVPLVNAVVGTFTDVDTIENANSYTATIGWGDGSYSAGSIAYTGQSTVGGVTVNDYSITGTHTYLVSGAETTSLALTDLGGTFTTTSGGIPITTTLGPAGTVSEAGPTIDVNGLAAATAPTAPIATAGTLLSSAPVVAFTDDPAPLAATAYAAVINWGDGTAVSGGTITLASGVFTVSGSHDYAAPGTYPISVVIAGDSQQLTLTTTATVTGLVASTMVFPSYVAGTPTGAITIANFGAATGSPAVTDTTGYSALVDWGDGSAPSVASLGSLVSGTFSVNTSGHTYAQGGTYTATVTVRDAQGVVVGTSSPQLLVIVTPLTGRLSPQSDTGPSDSDGITSDTTPTFVGHTSPGATIDVFEAPSGSTSLPGTQIAVGATNSAGAWTATVVDHPLSDGSYTITAEAVNSSGSVLNTVALGTVVIDTVGPVITAVSFNRFTDTVTVTYQDSLSGLDYASIANSAFYHLSAKPLAADVPVPKLLLPTSITIKTGATATSPEVVKVVFNHGRTVRGGRYLIVINSGIGNEGVQDIAGNALDGNFYGTFPSGDGLNGSNFAASIATYHNGTVLAPVPVQDGYVAPGSAVLDPPVTSKPVKNVKKVVRAAARAELVRQQAVTHDLAIGALIDDKKKNHAARGRSTS